MKHIAWAIPAAHVSNRLSEPVHCVRHESRAPTAPLQRGLFSAFEQADPCARNDFWPKPALITDQEVGGSSPSGRAEGALVLQGLRRETVSWIGQMTLWESFAAAGGLISP